MPLYTVIKWFVFKNALNAIEHMRRPQILINWHKG